MEIAKFISLETIEVVLVQAIFSLMIHDSNKSLGQLLDISPKSFIIIYRSMVY